MLSINLESAFALIIEQRDKLSAADHELSAVIRHVEAALTEVKVGVPFDVAYPAGDEAEGEEHWLSFQKYNGQWTIMHARSEEGQQQPLVSATRGIRADVFKATLEGPSPIELLILEAADAIMYYEKERGPLVERARALSEALMKLGYAKPTAQ